jgi:hypothetical protein
MWKSRAWLLTVLSLVVLLVSLEGCATSGKPKPSGRRHSKLEAAGITRQQAAGTLDETYNQAIVASAVFRADHQVSDLRQVTPQNVPVVMGSFISCEACNCGNGQPQPPTCSSKCCAGAGTQTFSSDVWVSFGDQVFQFCSQFPQQDLVLRMQQLQGLPPQLDQPIDSWKFLVVKVTSPNQLFRPCADPSPSNPGPCSETFPTSASLEHQAWIANQALFAWQQYTDNPSVGGYPWTRLGYTYNWNPAASIVGTSEFVIPEGTSVEVCGVVPATEFCAQGSDPASYCSASK